MSALRNSVAWLVASLRGVLVKITEHTEKAALIELSCRQPRELCAGCARRASHSPRFPLQLVVVAQLFGPKCCPG